MGTCTRFIVCFTFLCCLTQTVCAGAPKKLYTAGDFQVLGDIYSNGFHVVKTERVRNGSICCPLWVAIPVDVGHYPVVQFQHGFQLQNTDYTALISQVASWGFIVVAPQMYSFLPGLVTSGTTEIRNARSILNWMRTGLIASLPPAYAKHQPDFDKVALAGHSRGGLVVFGLALNYSNSSMIRPYSAIVGLDPVDASWPMAPVILPHEENKMDVGVPTLIVGTGLSPACAPEYRGHVNFFKDVTPTSFHFVAPKNGHMEFTEDCGLIDRVTAVRCSLLCKPIWGRSRQPMRQFAAGIMVAFLQDVLLHNNASLLAALSQSVPAPVPLDLPQRK